MAGAEGQPRSGRVKAVNLPGNYWGDEIPLHVGIQNGNEVEQIVPAISGHAWFAFDFRLIDEGEVIDVRGPFIHGRKGDRFLYLSWGHESPAEPFVRYARSKLMFNDMAPDLLRRLHDEVGNEVVVEVEATNKKGTEASGTIRPPQVTWRLVDSTS